MLLEDCILNKVEIDNIPMNDPAVWKMFADGRTKGIFQLESNLGRSWAKKVKPENEEELAALISIIRPGSLKAMYQGKSMSQHYVDRKHGLEPVEYLHDSLIDILGPTYGVLIYQEQAMRIAQKLAGFTEEEADILRKAIGKKKADVMAAVKKDFMIGCAKVGIVTPEEAEEIFGWIEKSARYSFNKSHAAAYGKNGYWSAWFKTYHVREFFVAYFRYAKGKQDAHQEIYELASEAKLFNLELKTPSIANFKKQFNCVGDKIYFGVKEIKALTGKNGDKAFEAVKDMIKLLDKKIENISWIEILLFFSPNVNSTVFKTLASIGFFRGMKDRVTRNKALYDYEIFRMLTKAETQWAISNYKKYKWKNLEECLTTLAPTKKEGGGTSKEDRKQAVLNEIRMLKNPPFSLEDDPEWVIDQEIKYLGCPVSMSKIEATDISGNTTCKEIADGKSGQKITIAANITRVFNTKVKKEGASKGKDMSFLTIEDETCSLDTVVVFPEAREESKYSLFEGNNVIISGVAKGDGSLIVEKISDI